LSQRINPELRPIGARALKSAIDTLRPWLAESRLLDLYSGQGRFGISALDEGAGSVLFVEKDPRTARELENEIRKRKYADRGRIVTADALRTLKELGEKKESFDVIFADPPFPIWTPEFAQQLSDGVAAIAAPGSIFLVKHPDRVLPSLSIRSFEHWKTSRFGESKLIYFKYGKPD